MWNRFLGHFRPLFGAGWVPELLEIGKKGHFTYKVQGWLGGRKPGKSTFFFFFRDFFHIEQIYKEIPAVGGGIDFLAGGRFRSLSDHFHQVRASREKSPNVLRKRPPAEKSMPPPTAGISLQLYSMWKKIPEKKEKSRFSGFPTTQPPLDPIGKWPFFTISNSSVTLPAPKRGLKWPKNRFHKFFLQFFFT